MQTSLSARELYDWQEKPWLTYLALGCFFLSLAVLVLALAFWLAPDWLANISPVASFHGHTLKYSVLPQQAWRARTPTRTWFHAPPSDSPQSTAYTGPPRWLRNATIPLAEPGPAASVKKIAIVLDDMGVNGPLSTVAIQKLPPSITLSFLSYGRATSHQAQLARMKGHEIMIHLPMEPESTADPGPNAILADMPADVVQKQTTIHLDALKNLAVGVNNHMGSKATQQLDIMHSVLNAVAREKLFFLDSITTSRPASRRLTQTYDIPILERDVFIDHYIDEGQVAHYLNKLEQVAAREGTAIGIGHPHPETVNALLKWLPTLEARGFKVVPITQVMMAEAGR